MENQSEFNVQLNARIGGKVQECRDSQVQEQKRVLPMDPRRIQAPGCVRALSCAPAGVKELLTPRSG